jgi:hypothetical protein
MISSEVQRTLVKSPPELWAEISDPDALARHLGEFGEIRITRVQPEQKVEWEADEASGSVVIKPSGWGTKVKLSVTRELPEIAAPEQAAPDALDVDAEIDAQPLADAPESALEAEETSPEPADDREPTPEEDFEAEYAADDDEADDSSPELVAETEPLREIEPLPEAELLPEAESLPDSEPEPRRGFFARLFGRRRAARVAELASDGEPYAEADAELSAAEPHEPEAEHYETISDWEAEVVPEAEHDGAPQLDAHDEAELQTQLDANTESEPGLEASGEPGLEAQGASTDEARKQLEPIDDIGAVELLSNPGASEEPAETPAALDMAAELEAAEAVAAEHVTAVLTGVLDRLGAAHHRPFSRA